MTLCFPEELLAAVERQALALQPGARIVAMHSDFGDHMEAVDEEEQPFRPLPVREQLPRHAVPTEMSFGETNLYVFERAGSRAIFLDTLD